MSFMYGDIRNIKNPDETYTCNCVDGKCSGCGSCCSDILPLSDREVARIKAYVKAHNLREHRQAPVFDPNVTDFTCPFRNPTEKRCDIYPVRPEICRSFICSKSLEDARKDRDRLYTKQRPARSMRYEFFGNPETRQLIAMATAITALKGMKML